MSAAPIGLELSLAEKRYLLRQARGVVAARLQFQEEQDHGPPEAMLHERMGAFVTIRRKSGVHRAHQLRGCIGHIVSSGSLIETVRDSALSAAFHDPRFPPLTPAEYNEVEFEISVLSPLHVVEDRREVIPGTHGVLVRKGWKSGLLLPQVATEQKWDRDTFLYHTCIKAGFEPGCIDDADVEISVFTATVFDESIPGM